MSGSRVDRLTLVCATANPGKVAELRAILGDQIELLPRPADVPDVVEDSGSLVGNARLKAAAVATAVGMPAIADDTGLEVDELSGLPGVETATFAGAHASDSDNRHKLLTDLDGVTERAARFRTVAMVVWPNGDEAFAEGVCDGEIAESERGPRGFGYDSVFVPTVGDGRTFAEMTADEKNVVSHRGKAFSSLIGVLAARQSARGSRRQS